MRNTIVAVTIAALLAACSGNDSSSASQPISSQSKQLLRSDKAVASDYQTVVQELYVAYFGRPADPTGLANFENALLGANAPTDIQSLSAAYATSPAIQSLINSFGASAESLKLYGSGNPTAFVTAIFQNVLGRTPQQSGLTYWANAISSGQLSQGDAALAIMAGALSNTTAQGVLDGDLIENRLTVAGYFTAQVSGQNAVSDYAGATAATSARTMLNTVTAATDTTAYQSIVNTAVVALFGTGIPNLQAFAGNTSSTGSADGTGAAARFNEPVGVATDSAGNIYVADTVNHTIRKVTPIGVTTTLAGTPGISGSADGTGAAASFNSPYGIGTDGAGNIYVTDSDNTIRKITPAGVVTTLAGKPNATGSADGAGAAASFNNPTSIAVDRAGNLYVADSGNNTIRKITSAGLVTTLAGTAGVQGSADGTGAAASFGYPSGLATDSAGNVYVADTDNYAIRKITPAGTVTTVISGLIGAYGVAIDSAGNFYVPTYWICTVLKVTPAGVVTTLAGTQYVAGNANGTGTAAGFNAPVSVATDSAGDVYVADTLNDVIRKITPAGVVTTLAGTADEYGSANGTGTAASFNDPTGVATDSAGNVYVADYYNSTIRKITAAGAVTTLAGTAGGFGGSADGTGSAAAFNYPQGVATDTTGNVYVADTASNIIRKVTPAGVVTTLAGSVGSYSAVVTGSADGTGVAASFDHPTGIVTDGSGNVYVADTLNNTLRKITPAGVVTTLAGSAGIAGSADGTGAAASFNHPIGLATDSAGNVYVVDSHNSTIRKVTPFGVVTTLAGSPGVTGNTNGTGTAASFNFANHFAGIAIDSTGNIYVADINNNAIRKITPIGVVTTLVGVQAAGFLAGALPGGLSAPLGIAISGTSLYIATDQGIAVVNNVP
jgi:hypothetical protein